MTRRQLIILLLCITAALGMAIWYGVCRLRTRERENKILSTNSYGYAEEEIPHADLMIVGRWQNTENPQWYKVYYDDYDEERRMFWGKEWDESEGVFEDYLQYHGNGWFRWEKKGTDLREYATMDARDIPALNTYKILFSSTDSLAYREKDYKKIVYRFVKVKQSYLNDIQ